MKAPMLLLLVATALLGSTTTVFVDASPLAPSSSSSSFRGGSSRTKAKPSSSSASVFHQGISATEQQQPQHISTSEVHLEQQDPNHHNPPNPQQQQQQQQQQHPKQQQQQQPDSLPRFAADVTHVLRDLRSDKHDPALPQVLQSDLRPTFAVTWTHDMWENHTSRWRFVHQFWYWHRSALLQRVLPQLSCLMVWTLACVYLTPAHKVLPNVVQSLKFPMTSLSLVSGFVASLLALRTNQGMSRLLEARQAFGKVVLYTRDMASIVSNFLYDKDPQLALKLARHLTAFSWLLKAFLRGGRYTSSEDNQEGVDDLVRALLQDEDDASYVMQQRKLPVAIVMRLRQALAHCTHRHLLSTAEELAMDHTIQAMDLSIMVTERIIASPIPPLFTTHAGRLMVFYLAFLPIALLQTDLNPMGIVLTVMVVGYAMLGLDEISHLMEQPFKVCPLWHLCKNSMRDVADAFCVRPPALHNKKNNADSPQYPPPYWLGDHTGPLEAGHRELDGQDQTGAATTKSDHPAPPHHVAHKILNLALDLAIPTMVLGVLLHSIFFEG